MPKSKKGLFYMAIQVQKISCVNSAAFVMEFKVKYSNENGDELNVDWAGGTYPVGQSRTCDLSEIGNKLSEGTPVWIEVHALGGLTKQSNSHKFIYGSNGQSTTFKVTGTTLSYSIEIL